MAMRLYVSKNKNRGSVVVGKIDISKLKNNQLVQGALVVSSVKLAVAKNNKKYLDATLSDGANTINCKKWDYAEEVPEIGQVIIISGIVGEFAGSLQLVISRMSFAKPEDGLSITDFVPHSKYTKEELWQAINKYTNLILDDEYRTFVTQVFEQYKDKIEIAPAALKHHHAYVGGLLQHTCEVTRLALIMADDSTNISLLVSGCLLHDIGKIYTYKLTGCVIDMTDTGKLLDHIVIGEEILVRVGLRYAINKTKYVLLQHMIASHHGELEWGSPVRPAFKEAYMLHMADLINTRVTKLDTLSDETPVDTNWSAYSRDFNRSILVPTNNNYTLDPIIW